MSILARQPAGGIEPRGPEGAARGLACKGPRALRNACGRRPKLKIVKNFNLLSRVGSARNAVEPSVSADRPRSTNRLPPRPIERLFQGHKTGWAKRRRGFDFLDISAADGRGVVRNVCFSHQ